MRVSVLASGSRGNSTYLETEKYKILIDMGTTTKYIEEKLMELGINPSSIDFILLTHDHNDHISALKAFLKKYHTKVYLTEKLKISLDKIITIENFNYFNTTTIVDTLKIDVIKTSHDASDSVGFIIEEENTSLVYITDTGYINVKYFEVLKNKNMYIIESNHDIEMLMNGKYRHDLKVRILGDSGHLSNEMTANYLSDFIGNKTTKIILIHLSEENNTEELAYKMLTSKIKDKKIIIAKQNERTDLIDI